MNSSANAFNNEEGWMAHLLFSLYRPSLVRRSRRSGVVGAEEEQEVAMVSPLR